MDPDLASASIVVGGSLPYLEWLDSCCNNNVNEAVQEFTCTHAGFDQLDHEIGSHRRRVAIDCLLRFSAEDIGPNGVGGT